MTIGSTGPTEMHWPNVERVEHMTECRSVQTTLKLNGQEFLVIVGATRNNGARWSEPRALYPSVLSLDRAQARSLESVVEGLFRLYAGAYGPAAKANTVPCQACKGEGFYAGDDPSRGMVCDACCGAGRTALPFVESRAYEPPDLEPGDRRPEGPAGPPFGPNLREQR